MEGFTNVNSRRRHARKARKAAEAARVAADARIVGAVWSDIPLSRSHLPGIPYSYYDDEIVMLRQCTAELIAHQRADARARVRKQQNRHHHNRRNVQPAELAQVNGWYTYEKNKKGGRCVLVSEWEGVDE